MTTQTDHDRARIIEAHDTRAQEAYWGGEPDDDQDDDLLQEALDDARREAMDARIELANTRLALYDATHALRRAEIVLRGEAARTQSDVLLAVANECRNAMENRT